MDLLLQFFTGFIFGIPGGVAGAWLLEKYYQRKEENRITETEFYDAPEKSTFELWLGKHNDNWRD